MVVDFIIHITVMKEQMLTQIYMSEYKAFEDGIKAGKVTINRDDNLSNIVVTINDSKLEEDFIAGITSLREKASFKLLRALGVTPKILLDGKEVKI